MIRSLQPLLIAACLGLGVPQSANPQPITVDGTARLTPINQEVARQFKNLTQPSTEVTIQASDTATGFKKLCRGAVDINGATRPILLPEIDLCKQAGIELYELPIAYDVLTVVVNAQNYWVTSMSMEALKQLWGPSGQNRINRWNQLRPQWPAYSIRLFGSPPDSEVFEFFSVAIDRKAKALRNDVNQLNSSSELIQAIGGNPLAIGYCPIADCGKNLRGIRVVPLDFGLGPISPTATAVQNNNYRTLSRPLFLYINRKSTERVAVHQFVALYLLRAHQIVYQVGYLPLSSKTYKVAVNVMKNKKVGSAYGGLMPDNPTVDAFVNSNASLR